MKSLPSVTQVLGIYADFTMIKPEVLAYASDRGRRIHEYIATILQSLYVSQIDEDCQPYIHSFKLWADRHIEEVVWVEKHLSDPERGYQGHPDALIRMVGDKTYTVPDWKSPITQQKTWPLQVAAYGNLSQQDHGYIFRIGALQLSPKGKMAKLRDYSDKYEYYFSLFLNALSIHQYLYGR